MPPHLAHVVDLDVWLPEEGEEGEADPLEVVHLVVGVEVLDPGVLPLDAQVHGQRDARLLIVDLQSSAVTSSRQSGTDNGQIKDKSKMSVAVAATKLWTIFSVQMSLQDMRLQVIVHYDLEYLEDVRRDDDLHHGAVVAGGRELQLLVVWADAELVAAVPRPRPRPLQLLRPPPLPLLPPRPRPLGIFPVASGANNTCTSNCTVKMLISTQTGDI